MRNTLQQIRAIVQGAASPAAMSRRARTGVYLARLGIRILKQWAHDRCPQQAAALAFQSTLSLVPVLAIAVWVLRSTGSLDAQSRLIEFLATQILPDREIAEHLAGFSEKISTNAAGAGGLLFTFIACYSLYAYVEKIFNDIWRVGTRRALMRKLLTFYALVTLLPVLAGFYLYWSGKLMASGPAAQVFGPLLIQFVGLFLTNKLLPVTHVSWPAALAGTMVSGVFLEGLKWGFVTFAKQVLFASYSGIYGPVALVPMLLIWIYASWVIILLGAEVANAIQNMRLLEAEDRRRRGEEPINGLVAAQLLAAVADEYERGGRGLDREALSQEFGLSSEVIDRIFARLKTRGLIAEVQGDKQGFIPGRPARTIPIADVFAAFRSTDVETAQGATSPALSSLIADIDEARRARIEGLTLFDVLPSRVDAPSRGLP